ncbi:MFS transporter [Mumia sp. DW29H23]|uniref:MFS transporter n=1 Tax=Mumia sp. DW29H23 TaxID=3421241 RepID=UPI003D687EE5
MTVPSQVSGRTRLRPAMRAVAGAWMLSASADVFLVFALLWLAEPQGWSGAQTALLILATRLPVLLGGVVGGRAVDRFGPRAMLLVDGCFRTVVLGVLAVSARDESLDLLLVVVLTALAGFTEPMSYAAARTLVVRYEPPHLRARANALLALGDQLPLVLSAAFLGAALTTFGIGVTLAVPAVLMLGVAVIAVLLPRTAPPSAAPGGAGSSAVPHDAADGSPWRIPGVKALVALSAAYYAAYGPFEPALPPFVRDDLGGGADAFGLIWTMFGIGAIATVPLAPRLSRWRPGVVNAIGAATWGVVTLPLVLLDSVPPAAVVMLLSGAVWGPYAAIETTALQQWSPPARHGRLFGTQRALLATASPFGAALGALALDVAEPAVVLAVSTLACSAAGLITLTRPGIRRRAEPTSLAPRVPDAERDWGT